MDTNAHLAREALGSRVTALLRHQIESGAWPIGAKIPVEAELVNWTGAGRNTVRESISSLVASGLLSREQGRGTFVLAMSDLRASVDRRAGTTTKNDSLELRLALDAMAAELAAARRTELDTEILQKLLSDRDQAWQSADRDERIRTDVALHRCVIVIAGNALLREVWDGLQTSFEAVLRDDVDAEVDYSGQVHGLLVQAIVDKDSGGARQATADLLTPLIEGPRSSARRENG